jgi:thiol-disulfide isomerase/thioredoxin
MESGCGGRAFIYLATGIIFSLFLMLPASAQGQSSLSIPSEVRADSVYGRVGEWFVLRDLEGSALPFSNLQGRVLFVNFWATWCAPCVEEMPTISILAESLRDTDVEFLLISIDDFQRDVRRFVSRQQLTVPVYLRGWKPGESVFAGDMVPATFIVNKEGKIAYQHHGAADWNTESIRRFLTELAQQ